MKKSTYLRSISYDPEQQSMDVVFADTAVIRYYGVLRRTFDAIDRAASPGEKFTELVRDRHSYRTLKAA